MFGQTKLTETQQKNVIERIDKAASAMNSMQCKFTQTKKMKILSKAMQSTGTMHYKSPNQLRWQYTSPYNYTFIINNNKVFIKSGKSTQKIDTQENKIFRQITKIILDCVTGGGIKSTSDFKFVFYKSGKIYFAKLYPKKKELKQIYNNIEIYFNPELTMVNTVKMEEKTGDTTIVELQNVVTNSAIDEKVFALH